MIKIPLVCVLAFFSVSLVQAQAVRDTSFLKTALANTANIYHEFITIHSGILSGVEYKQPPYSETQHPFYLQNDWMTGDVVYNGELYTDANLLYDLSSDNLVLENPVNGLEIQLVKVKVAQFSLGRREFTHVYAEDYPGLSQSGFYEVLYEGQSRVLARHHKQFEEKIESSRLVFYYVSKSRYFIKSGDQYVRVSRKGDVLKLFASRKSELRSYIRQHNLRVDKHNPDSFAALAAYYDTLMHTE